LAKQALRLDNGSANATAAVNMAAAHQQHANMVNHLKRIGLAVTELPSDGLPDSVFVEDTVVIVQDVAMITVPGAISRRLETKRIKETLQDMYKGSIRIVQQESGILDGGDVLFTGEEFFVGISERTDLAGIAALQAAFPRFNVNPIDISKIGAQHGVLHLKSACSMCGEGHVLTGGVVGSEIAKAMQRSAPLRYRYSHVVDAAASNCVYVNGHLLRRSGEEFPHSSAALTAIGGVQIEVESSELAKVDGALTCCSVLF
jgi:dimethylargininase